LQGKKVREHPLIGGGEDNGQAPAGAFGQQNKNVLYLD